MFLRQNFHSFTHQHFIVNANHETIPTEATGYAIHFLHLSLEFVSSVLSDCMAKANAHVDSVLPQLGQSNQLIPLLMKSMWKYCNFHCIKFAKNMHSRPGTHVFKNAF